MSCSGHWFLSLKPSYLIRREIRNIERLILMGFIQKTYLLSGSVEMFGKICWVPPAGITLDSEKGNPSRMKTPRS